MSRPEVCLCFFVFFTQTFHATDYPYCNFNPGSCLHHLTAGASHVNVTWSTFSCFKSTFSPTFCVLMQGWKPIKCTEENILQPGWMRCAAIKSIFWASKLWWELLISIFSSYLNIQSLTWAVGGQCRLLFEWSIVINTVKWVSQIWWGVQALQRPAVSLKHTP